MMTSEPQIETALTRLRAQRDAVGDPNDANSVNERARRIERKRVADARLTEAWNLVHNVLPGIYRKLDAREAERRELRRRRVALQREREPVSESASNCREHVTKMQAWRRQTAIDAELQVIASQDRVVITILSDLQERQQEAERRLATLVIDGDRAATVS